MVETTQTSQYVQSHTEPGIIDLRIGQPAPGTLPVDLIRQAALHRFGRDEGEGCDRELLGYAVPRGYREFRQALASFLTERIAGPPVGADDLMITTGVSHGIDLCARMLARPGDVVLVEEPTYFLCVKIFTSAGLTVVAAPTDEEGIVVDDSLETLIATHTPRLLYTVPIHNNPTGATLPPARRQRLVDLSRRHGFTIVADEVYQLMGFSPDVCSLLPMRAYDTNSAREAVVSLASFAKILAPAWRVGWIHAGPQTLQRLLCDPALTSGGSYNPLTAAMAHSALQLGLLQTRVPTVNADLARRRDALCEALDASLCRPGAHPSASYRRPRGGYFVWLRLPGIDTRRLLARARTHGVSFLPGAIAAVSSVVGPPLSESLRLAFSFYTCEELTEGVRRLSVAVREEYEGSECTADPPPSVAGLPC